MILFYFQILRRMLNFMRRMLHTSFFFVDNIKDGSSKLNAIFVVVSE